MIRREPKSARVVCKLRVKEAAALDAAAESAGYSRSGFVRRAVLIAAGLKPEKKTPKRSKWQRRTDRRAYDQA